MEALLCHSDSSSERRKRFLIHSVKTYSMLCSIDLLSYRIRARKNDVCQKVNETDLNLFGLIIRSNSLQKEYKTERTLS